MIDIIEAGKFYNDCLKKVKEATLKESILPENTALNARVDLMNFQGGCSKKAVGAFELNNINYVFEADIDRNDSLRVIMYKVRQVIAERVADAITNSIDWNLVENPK